MTTRDRDALEGAREDLLDWKHRALSAESLLRSLGYRGLTASEAPAEPDAGESQDAVTLSAPERIWLQVDTDSDDRSEPIARDSWIDLSWHYEPIGGVEVEYVRNDLASRHARQVPDGWGVSMTPCGSIRISQIDGTKQNPGQSTLVERARYPVTHEFLLAMLSAAPPAPEASA